MTFQLVCIEPKELTQYKSDMQEAFQKGFEDVFGKTDAVILPEKDIDQSLNAEGSAVYKAVVDGEMVGGAVVIINESIILSEKLTDIFLLPSVIVILRTVFFRFFRIQDSPNVVYYIIDSLIT